MNFRTTYILLGIVGVLLVGLAFYVWFAEDKTSGEGYLLSSFRAANYKPGDINALTIERGTETLTFTRDEATGWKITSPITARADSRVIDTIIRQAMETRTVTDGVDITPNPATHGLDKPPVKLTFKKGDKSITVSLGKMTLGGSLDQKSNLAAIYVQTPGSKPMAVRRDSLAGLFKPGVKFGPDTNIADVVRSLKDFRSTELLGAGLQDEPIVGVSAIRITKGKKELYLSRENAAKIWQFVIPAGYGDAEVNPVQGSDPAFISSVRELLNKVVLEMKVNDAANDFIDNVTDLNQYGLDPTLPETMVIELFREGVGSEKLIIGKQVDLPKRDLVYAQYLGDSSAAMINASAVRALERLLADPTRLRERYFVKLRPTRVDAIDFDVSGAKFDLRRISSNPPIWKVYAPDGSEANANADAIESMLKELSKPDLVRGYPAANSKEADMGLSQPTVQINIWESGLTKIESKGKSNPQGNPTYRLAFGKKDVGDVLFARRTMGTSTLDVKIPDRILTLVSRSRMDYLDVSLSSFSIDEATTLTFTRGTETFEISRDEKDMRPASLSEWTIQSPATRKGKLADTGKVINILALLAGMKPLKVVTDKPTTDQLKTLALDPMSPRIRIGVKIRGVMAERVYYLGNETGMDKQNVFVKTGDSDIIFETTSGIVLATQTGEIQDLVVYKLEPSQITGLKIQGWADIVGEVTTRELEKKDGVWTLTKGTYPIDNTQVDAFLEEIARPKADEFITGDIKPAYKLDLPAGAMQIDIKTTDGKVHTLVLGGADPTGRHVYATASSQPGQVFTLLKDRFKTVREKPIIFKKDVP